MNYAARPLPQGRREREGLGRILPARRFSLYLQGRGNRADASAEVVADNETDCVFPWCKVQCAAVCDPSLVNRSHFLRCQMSLNFLAYGMIDCFAFGCFRKRYEVEHKMVIFGGVDQRAASGATCIP